jgi:release factor glutamine methyltransferase
MSSEAPPPAWTILALLRWAGDYLASHGVESPRAAAEILLARVLTLRRIDLYLRHDQPLTPAELARFKPLLLRRARREPVAYITGERDFWTLTLAVGPAVLIPRPETERLVEAALERLPASAPVAPRVVDLGTGSGAVILALACERPQAICVAVDRCAAALAVARANARRNGLQSRIRYCCGRWLEPFSEAHPFDLIVSNPPYIPTAVLERLAPEITRFEPRLALDGGPDGLTAIRALIHAAPRHLTPGGWLLVETGDDQRPAIMELVAADGRYGEVHYLQDLAGRDRVLCARRRLEKLLHP